MSSNCLTLLVALCNCPGSDLKLFSSSVSLYLFINFWWATLLIKSFRTFFEKLLSDNIWYLDDYKIAVPGKLSGRSVQTQEYWVFPLSSFKDNFFPPNSRVVRKERSTTWFYYIFRTKIARRLKRKVSRCVSTEKGSRWHQSYPNSKFT